jgi:hypothetical protein
MEIRTWQDAIIALCRIARSHLHSDLDYSVIQDLDQLEQDIRRIESGPDAAGGSGVAPRPRAV